MKIRIECAKSYMYGSKEKEIECFVREYGEKMKKYGLKVDKKRKVCYISVTSLKQLFEILKEYGDLILRYDEETENPYIIVYDDVIY